MKKTILIITILLLIFGIAYMINNFNNNSQGNNNIEDVNKTKISEVDTTSGTQDVVKENINENKRLKLSFDNEEIYVTLEENNSTQDLLKMLPLTVKFEDYNNTEKIAMLDAKLDTSDAPSGYDPQIGDFAYYAPWGNLSVFYKDFRYSNSLIKLGIIENDIEKMQNIVNGTEIKIEEAKE